MLFYQVFLLFSHILSSPLSSFVHISRIRSSARSVHIDFPPPPSFFKYKRITWSQQRSVVLKVDDWEGGAERDRLLQMQKEKWINIRWDDSQRDRKWLWVCTCCLRTVNSAPRRLRCSSLCPPGHSSSTLTAITVREWCIHKCVRESGSSGWTGTQKTSKFFLAFNIWWSAVIWAGVRKLLMIPLPGSNDHFPF